MRVSRIRSGLVAWKVDEVTAALGLTPLDASEAGPVPVPFVARAVNVYRVPGTSPVTVQDSSPSVRHVRPPGDAVASYALTGEFKDPDSRIP